MTKFLSISLFAFLLALAAAPAGAQPAPGSSLSVCEYRDYLLTKPEAGARLYDRVLSWRFFDQPDEGRMTMVSMYGAMYVPDYCLDAAAAAFLTSSGRTCTVDHRQRMFSNRYEVRYSCGA